MATNAKRQFHRKKHGTTTAATTTKYYLLSQAHSTVFDVVALFSFHIIQKYSHNPHNSISFMPQYLKLLPAIS